MSYLEYLAKHDPTLCASVVFPKIFPFDPRKYVDEMPDDISAAKSKVFNKMLVGPTVSPRPLSKADRRYADKKHKLIALNVSKKFSQSELRRLLNLKQNRDAKIACKFGIANGRYFLQDSRLIGLLPRYGDKL